VDPVRAGQAVVNLVDNALTHGSGTVELAVEERDGLIELHVLDEGEGIPEDFRPRAFDRFSRADEARSRGGSGLGLSIVELVARAHGGSAGLRNRPGGGADVWLSLPGAAPGDPPEIPDETAGSARCVLPA
jgi:signal transduction histidine kinase